MPKISVIIPVYNVEKYITQCLESLVNQTMNDLEFVCVNDGSTDNSLNILKNYAEKDSRFVIINQTNQGAGVARNTAIKAAKGEYLVCLDPDDWFELNAMEVLYKKLKETGAVALQFDAIGVDEISQPDKASYVYGTFSERLVCAGGNPIRINDYFDWKDKDNKKQFFVLAGPTWGRIYSTKFIRDNNIKFSEIYIGEDKLFGIMTLVCAPRIYYLNEFLYNYRVRANSLCRSLSDKYFYCPFICYDEIEEFLRNKGYFKELTKEFTKSKIYFFKMVYSLLPEASRENYKETCRKKLPGKTYRKIFRRKKLVKSILSKLKKIILGLFNKNI